MVLILSANYIQNSIFITKVLTKCLNLSFCFVITHFMISSWSIKLVRFSVIYNEWQSVNFHVLFFQISEMQEKTRHMMVLLAKLQKNSQMLETMKMEDATVWEQKLKEVTKIKVTESISVTLCLHDQDITFFHCNSVCKNVLNCHKSRLYLNVYKYEFVQKWY